MAAADHQKGACQSGPAAISPYKPSKLTLLGNGALEMQRTRVKSTLAKDLTVLACDDDMDVLHARMASAGCRVGLLLSVDGDLTVSDLDGCFIEVTPSNEFLPDLDKALTAANDYQVILVPCLENDAILLGWQTIDLMAASLTARLHGIKILVIVDDWADSSVVH